MIPEVHACSGYLVITPKRAYRDNAGALEPPETASPTLPHPCRQSEGASWFWTVRLLRFGEGLDCLEE